MVFADRLRLSDSFAKDLNKYMSDSNRGVPKFLSELTKNFENGENVALSISNKKYSNVKKMKEHSSIIQFPKTGKSNYRGFLCIVDSAVVLLSIGDVKNSGGATKRAIKAAENHCKAA